VLDRLPMGEQFTVSVETLDDVVFSDSADAKEVIQTKHHVRRAANLTDASRDLWKTIRVWAEFATEEDDVTDLSLVLMTTEVAPAGSAASHLRDMDRDLKAAYTRLMSVVQTSTNADNAKAYSAFKNLTKESRMRLLKSITIADGQTNIAGIDEVLRRKIYYAAGQENQASFLKRLEGWWLQRVVEHLLRSDERGILSEEIDDEIARLREQFKKDSLPIDDDIMQSSVDASGYEEHMFVDQLRLIGIGSPRILHAIRNYFRAFTQRSRWVKEELVMTGELERYEDRLREEWELRFEQMRDELGAEATEDAKQSEAQRLYQWVESGALPPIRKGVREPAIARGSYQILADLGRLGWHPEWAERLKGVLEGV